jgi:hypothetical protein
MCGCALKPRLASTPAPSCSQSRRKPKRLLPVCGHCRSLGKARECRAWPLRWALALAGNGQGSLRTLRGARSSAARLHRFRESDCRESHELGRTAPCGPRGAADGVPALVEPVPELAGARQEALPAARRARRGRGALKGKRGRSRHSRGSPSVTREAQGRKEASPMGAARGSASTDPPQSASLREPPRNIPRATRPE